MHGSRLGFPITVKRNPQIIAFFGSIGIEIFISRYANYEKNIMKLNPIDRTEYIDKLWQRMPRRHPMESWWWIINKIAKTSPSNELEI